MMPGILVFVLGFAVIARVVGIGPWAPDEETVSSDSGARSGPTTSTTSVLAGREYKAGDCVIWNQEPGAGAYRNTRVVACEGEHLIEITGRVDGGDHFTSE